MRLHCLHRWISCHVCLLVLTHISNSWVQVGDARAQTKWTVKHKGGCWTKAGSITLWTCLLNGGFSNRALGSTVGDYVGTSVCLSSSSAGKHYLHTAKSVLLTSIQPQSGHQGRESEWISPQLNKKMLGYTFRKLYLTVADVEMHGSSSIKQHTDTLQQEWKWVQDFHFEWHRCRQSANKCLAFYKMPNDTLLLYLFC